MIRLGPRRKGKAQPLAGYIEINFDGTQLHSRIPFDEPQPPGALNAEGLAIARAHLLAMAASAAIRILAGAPFWNAAIDAGNDYGSFGTNADSRRTEPAGAVETPKPTPNTPAPVPPPPAPAPREERGIPPAPDYQGGAAPRPVLPATEAQLKAIYAIGRGAHSVDDETIRQWSRDKYGGRTPEELNRREASLFIDSMKTNQGGRR